MKGPLYEQSERKRGTHRLLEGESVSLHFDRGRSLLPIDFTSTMLVQKLIWINRSSTFSSLLVTLSSCRDPSSSSVSFILVCISLPSLLFYFLSSPHRFFFFFVLLTFYYFFQSKIEDVRKRRENLCV